MSDTSKVREYAEELLDILQQRNELITALDDLVNIIEKAGLMNLSNGVELGQASWYVKANDRLEYAKSVLNTAHIK